MKSTLAWGLSVDLSESEPTDELGDNPGTLDTETAFPQSDVDDAELPGLVRAITDCVVPCGLTDGAFSDKSVGQFFS